SGERGFAGEQPADPAVAAEGRIEVRPRLDAGAEGAVAAGARIVGAAVGGGDVDAVDIDAAPELVVGRGGAGRLDEAVDVGRELVRLGRARAAAEDPDVVGMGVAARFDALVAPRHMSLGGAHCQPPSPARVRSWAKLCVLGAPAVIARAAAGAADGPC